MNSIGFKRRHEDINGNLQANKGPSSAWGMLNYMLAFNQEKDRFTVLAHDLQRQYSQKKIVEITH